MIRFFWKSEIGEGIKVEEVCSNENIEEGRNYTT